MREFFLRSIVISTLAIASIVLTAPKSKAITLSLETLTPSIGVGDSVVVDLNISGLGSFGTPSLGAFFAEILFDDSVLSLDSVSYGSFLGDTNPFAFETDILTTTAPNLVSLDEISFLFDFELNVLQPDSFTLASLVFSGDVMGSSTLGFGSVDLSTALGSSIFDPSLLTTNIDVGSTPAPVPEPSTIILLASGLLFLMVMKKSKRNSQDVIQ